MFLIGSKKIEVFQSCGHRSYKPASIHQRRCYTQNIDSLEHTAGPSEYPVLSCLAQFASKHPGAKGDANSLYDTPLDLSWISNSHPSDASDELCQRPGFHMTCWSQPMATSMRHMWWMTTSDWHPAMTWILRCLDAGQVGKVGNFGVWWTHLYQWTSHGGCEFSLLFRSCWTSKTAESRGHMRAHHVHTWGVARCFTRSRRWGMAGVSPSQNADADMFGGFKCLRCCDPDGGGFGKIAALDWFGG